MIAVATDISRPTVKYDDLEMAYSFASGRVMAEFSTVASGAIGRKVPGVGHVVDS